jgi:Tol biopolymer transport system component
MDSTAPSGFVARAAALSSLVLLVVLPGCEIPVEPDRPAPPSELTLLLENPQWALDSIALRGASPGRLSILATHRGGPAHAIRCAIFGDANAVDCGYVSCLPESETWASEAGMALSALDASWRGDLVAFQGIRERESPYVYVYNLASGALRPWVAGFEPTFTPEGEVIYVSTDRHSLLSFDPERAGGIVERSGIPAAANPTVSADGRFIAYSARDHVDDRRIFVHDRQDPRLYHPVSAGDHYEDSFESMDGEDDDHPAWSPGGRFIIYRTRLREDRGRDAIFITRVAANPPAPTRLALLGEDERISQLSWEASAAGERVLAVVDGKLFGIAVPARFSDP